MQLGNISHVSLKKKLDSNTILATEENSYLMHASNILKFNTDKYTDKTSLRITKYCILYSYIYRRKNAKIIEHISKDSIDKSEIATFNSMNIAIKGNKETLATNFLMHVVGKSIAKRFISLIQQDSERK